MVRRFSRLRRSFVFLKDEHEKTTWGKSSSCSVWQWRRIVVYVPLHDYVNVRVCNLHNPHQTGQIENHKQHTADLQLVALFPSHLVLVQFSGSETQAG